MSGFPLLHPTGIQSARIAALLIGIMAAGAAVYLITLLVLALAVRHGWRRARAEGGAEPGSAPGEPTPSVAPDAERRLGRVVLGAALLTALVLFIYIGASARTGRALNLLAQAPPGAPEPVTVSVTGHRWWWEFTYKKARPLEHLVTANELHVPVGRTVHLVGTSYDVIHSFWAPNLHGKRDLIPGYSSEAWFRADTPGVWTGECAEFCGLQHAHMRFVVVAQSDADYAAWYAGQLAPAAEPIETSRAHGEQVFLAHSCSLCHTIRGTPAGGRLGPDLTHVGSRAQIAAGLLPNTRGNLAGWILDPRTLKPGTPMPATSLSSSDLNSLVDYLEGL
ncbi:MAG TPA: c-type cytochrome [Gemmatimonadales bacterium]|nr:c-type cytochrome [Gemmatimonadales bacterium]